VSTRVIRVRSEGEVLAAAAEGADAVRRGKLVGFATETVYGIAAAASRSRTMARLRRLKSRPKQPFSVHLADPSDAGRYVEALPETAARIAARAWPGAVTLLVPTGGRLADRKLRRRPRLHEELTSNGLVGLRCPDEPVARAMLERVDLPVVAPSANLAGRPSPRTAAEVLDQLDGQLDLLIDSGPTRYGTDSTIVRCDAGGWSVVRKGVYDTAAIRRLLKRTILFVCTGNTCRSPMAAGLARKLLAERLGCEVGELRERGIEVLSAGAGSAGGGPTPEAVAAARRLGAEIASHRGRKLTRELITKADLVLCMTDAHVCHARRLAPEAGGKVHRLDRRGDVPDPMGGGPAVYRRAAERIHRALQVVLDEGLP
jgi:L-threonylcarbamoyladenylate synthase